jgi:hypothetical protein
MKKIYVFIFFLGSIHLNSQIVLDSITREPIQFAHITNEEGQGTTTNEEGKFSIEYFVDSNVLEFSHLAYLKKNLPKNNLSSGDTILLSPYTVSLEEVIVKGFSARDIIIEAINNIPNNILSSPFNLYGFYRESVEEDGKGAMLTEVSFIAYNDGGNDSQGYQAEIIKGRRTDNHTTLNLDAVGGIATIVQLADMVRSKIRMFDMDKLSDYTFEYVGEIESAENPILIIGFSPSNDNIHNNNMGKIYIERETMAIVQIETQKDPEKIKAIVKSLGVKKSKKPLFILTEAKAIIKYRRIQDKYFLSFVEVDNIRNGLLGQESYIYNSNAKYILTRADNISPIKLSTNYNIKEGFNKQVIEIPKMEDWSENNTMFFSEKEKKILKDIRVSHN